ncbi:MAG TPA: hypothetical protein V6D47_08555, partial [Oscillatoriaceae cyanobacterium]
MVLVIAEQRGGTLNRATWETIAAAQQAGSSAAKVAVIGSGVDAVANELAAADVAEVIVVDDPALAEYTADGFVQAVQGLVASEQPDLVFFPHTYQTRDFAPALAARLNRPLVTDCIAIRGGGQPVTYVRPVFQGKLQAEVVAEGP